MLVREPTAESDGGQVVLAAVFEPESRGREPVELRIGVPVEYEPWLDRSGTPFVPTATAIATATGEDARFEAAISPHLARGAEHASRTFARWWDYRPARIVPSGGLATPPTTAEPDGRIGLLFTRGVDTAATLIRSVRHEIPDRVTHLLSVYDVDTRYSVATREAVWRDTETVARGYGLPLVRMTTNVRDVLRGRIAWNRSFGAAFASVALAIGPRFDSLLFGAVQHPDHAVPRGSRWDLDPLWSTEATRIRQDAADLGKLERTAIVASDPLALRYLKVCWAADTPGNCGRCEKCLRTMTSFAIVGVAGWERAFEAPLEADAIRACRPSANAASVTAELVAGIPEEHAEIRSAWQEKLAELRRAGRRERRRQGRRRAQRTLRRLRRRIGRRRRRAWRRIRRRVARFPKVRQ